KPERRERRRRSQISPPLRRCANAVATIAAAEMEPLDAAFLALLARWNRQTNLTSLRIDPPDAHAIAKLIDEPQSAARWLQPDDPLAVDLGSGGGSPAVPLKIACPWLAFVLVESREKKCAFLRAVVRELELSDVQVEHCRFEELRQRRADLAARADVVTLRAVR